MAIASMPICRQLFDFLCFASIAISVAEASGRTYLCRTKCVHSGHRHMLVTQGCRWLRAEAARALTPGMGAASALTTGRMCWVGLSLHPRAEATLSECPSHPAFARQRC